MTSLRGRRQLRDLVQEQGAAVGQFEAPAFELVSAGKGAAFVAEQLRLDKRLRERRGVDREVAVV